MRNVGTLLLLASCVSAAMDEKNANGGVLQPCSTSGMAMTGGSREGYCVDSYGRYGSHICMNIENMDSNMNNFCEMEKAEILPACSLNAEFPCQDDTRNMCPVQNYCVHQCYFSHYLEEVGECDDIQDIKCDAVNIRSLIAYGKRSYKEKYSNALECIAKKCNVEDELLAELKKSKCGTTADSLFNMAMGRGNNDDIDEEVMNQVLFWSVLGGSLIVLGSVAAFVGKRRSNNSKMVEKTYETEGKVSDTDTVTGTVSIAEEL